MSGVIFHFRFYRPKLLKLTTYCEQSERYEEGGNFFDLKNQQKFRKNY